MSDRQECIWLAGQWKRSCLECAQEWKSCTFNGKVLILCLPEESCGEGTSKQQKIAKPPLSREALVLDALAGLMDEVLWLQKVVNQHCVLIISNLVDGLKEMMEEVGNPQWEPEKE